VDNIKKLNFIHSPIRKFHLVKILGSKSETLDLRSILRIDLRSDVKDQSLSRLISKNRSFEISRAAFLLGSAATLVLTVVILAQVVSADLNASMGAFLVWFSLFSVSYWGYSTLKSLGKEKFEPLHSNGQPIFKTSDMKNRWESFYDWARENDISLFMTEKDGGRYVMGPDFWNLDQNEIFILGDNSHRKELLKDTRQLTSHLYIQKSDWEAYIEFSKESDREIPSKETFVGVSKGESSEEPLKDEKLSLRQRLFKPGTKKALRFRMMVMYPELASRYYSMGINQSNLNEADKACHSAMMLSLEDPVLFHDATKNDGELQPLAESEILLKLNIALNITSKNHTRRNEILNYAWNKIELYLEGLNIISEDEVTKFYEGFEKNFPPGTDSKTIWKKIIS